MVKLGQSDVPPPVTILLLGSAMTSADMLPSSGIPHEKAQAGCPAPKTANRSASRRSSELEDLERAERSLPPPDASDVVMRTVNLLQWQDDLLRQVAFERGVSKNDLIRAAIMCKLDEWSGGDGSAFRADLQRGRIGLRN